MKTYTDRPTWYAYNEEGDQTTPRDRHATISVIKHRMGKLTAIDEYLCDCEQRFKVVYLKKLNGTALSAWENTMKELNAQLFPRGKNTILECLQFGGNREFWDSFESEQEIRRYFAACYAYAENKIGFLKTDENIISLLFILHRIIFLCMFYLPYNHLLHQHLICFLILIEPFVSTLLCLFLSVFLNI